LQGIDCPVTAAFMDATIFYGGMPHPKTFKNAICVFERHQDIPLLRHYSSTYKFYGAVPGGELVVRMISSVYNYDYIQVGLGKNLE
jgi:Cu2+-containing amine oxidase